LTINNNNINIKPKKPKKIIHINHILRLKSYSTAKELIGFWNCKFLDQTIYDQ